MENNIEIEIKYYINRERIAKGYSVRCLAAKSGVSKSQINDIENGNKCPTLHTLCLLAAALDVEPEQLYSYTVRYSGQMWEKQDKMKKT